MFNKKWFKEEYILRLSIKIIIIPFVIYLNPNNVGRIFENQCGFMKGRSTNTNLMEMQKYRWNKDSRSTSSRVIAQFYFRTLSAVLANPRNYLSLRASSIPFKILNWQDLKQFLNHIFTKFVSNVRKHSSNRGYLKK